MSKFKAVINGIMVTEYEHRPAALIIKDDKIFSVMEADAPVERLFPGIELIDAEGAFVVPGGVDGHVHFGGFGTIPLADDFVSGSRGALAGGTTTVVDFIETPEGADPVENIRQKKKQAEGAMTDYAFHFTFTEDYQRELSLLPLIIKEGITAFKCFTYYDHKSLRAGDFLEIMSAIHDKGNLLIHAEEKSVIDCLREKYPAKTGDYLPLSLTRPSLSEQIAVEEVLAIARKTRTTICIAHSSARETIDIKRREDALGNKYFKLETCPPYSCLTREKLKGEDGALFTINPPLRGKEDADAVMQGILDETVTMISTDHCAYLSSYKKNNTSYETVPCGVDGVQTRMPYIFSEGVMRRGLSPEAFVRLTSANAARFYRLYPGKGTIAIGSDADLAFFSPEGAGVFDKSMIAGAHDYSVMEGREFLGKCTCTIKGGEIVMRDGKVTARKESGKFLETHV